MEMLDVRRALVEPLEGAGSPPVLPATASPVPLVSRAPPGRRPSGRHVGALGATIALHAILGMLLWFAMPWQNRPSAPARIEVALIAPPTRVPPPPTPVPPKWRAQPPRDVIRFEPPPLLPPVAQPAAPAALTVPVPFVDLGAESPITAVTSTAPTSSSVVAAPPPVEFVPPSFDAAYLDNPAPAYPPAARSAREEGRVLLRVLVSAEGRASRVEIATSSGSPRLDEAAIEAVRRWRFVPARHGDRPVAAPVLVPIAFSLRR